MAQVTITVKELVEKLYTIGSFYAHDTKARDMQFNAIRFIVGNEIFNEAIAQAAIEID